MKGHITTWKNGTKTTEPRTKKPRKPLRKASAKQAKSLKEYSQRRKAFLERPENQWCPVMFKLHNRLVKTTDVHHQMGRGVNLNNESTWLAVSREGHELIHSRPHLARQHGWLK